jgi:hypothetical protein
MSDVKRVRRTWDRERRRRNDIDAEHALDADQEYARNEAEYQRFLNRQWDNATEGYDEPDPAYDPKDRADNEDLVGVWQRGRMP